MFKTKLCLSYILDSFASCYSRIFIAFIFLCTGQILLADFFVTHFSLRHKLYYKATEQSFSFINLNKKGDFIYERLWIWRLLVDHYPYSHILLLWLRRLRKWLWRLRKRLRWLWLRQWLRRLRMLI